MKLGFPTVSRKTDSAYMYINRQMDNENVVGI